jgi:hypothetical protein
MNARTGSALVVRWASSIFRRFIPPTLEIPRKSAHRARRQLDFLQHFSQWSQLSQWSTTAIYREWAIVRAVDALTVNGLHNAERGPGCQPKSKLRPMAALYPDAGCPVPGVDGRGRDAWAPIFFQTKRRANPSRRRFALDGGNLPSPAGGFPPFLERPAQRGRNTLHPWRRSTLVRPDGARADRRSRRVQASPTNALSVRPSVAVQPRAVAHFVAGFVALSPSLKPATDEAERSPSNTSTDFTVQQPTGRPARITALVATGSARLVHR